MSLSSKTTLTPCLMALSSALLTAGLVGVMAMPLTPFATMSWIAAISPASSVALLPWAYETVAPGCALSHFFAAFSSVKKNPTGNFVMNPSLIVAAPPLAAAGAFASGRAVAPAAAHSEVSSTAAPSDAPAKCRFLDNVRLLQMAMVDDRARPRPGGAFSGGGAGSVAVRASTSSQSAPPTISETICRCVSGVASSSPTLRPRRSTTTRSATSST